MEIIKSYKMKLCFTPEQEILARKTIDCCRLIYNLALQQRQMAWDLCSKSLNYYDQQRELPELRKEYPFLKVASAQSLRGSLKQLQIAFEGFFKNIKGYPSFRKKSKYKSFLFIQCVAQPKKLNKNYGIIKLPKFGQVKFRLSRDIKLSKVAEAAVKYDGDGWHLSLAGYEEFNPNPQETPLPGSIVALDRGIKHTIATSQASQQFYDMPLQTILSIESRISQLQRWQSSQRKGSHRWRKSQNRINKLYCRITRIRRDWLHKISTEIANNHSYVVLEDLDIQKMIKSKKGTKEKPGKGVKKKSRLNRDVLRQGWGYLRQFLEYKIKWRDGKTLEGKPFFSSQRCCLCLYIDENNRHVQNFKCLNCDFSIHADTNAALNLLFNALQKLYTQGIPLTYFKLNNLAAGLVVIARGGRLLLESSKKREPLGLVLA